jgi:hypothetical protein
MKAVLYKDGFAFLAHLHFLNLHDEKLPDLLAIYLHYRSL